MLWHAMWIGVESFAICFTESVEGISIQDWGKGGGGWGGEGNGKFLNVKKKLIGKKEKKFFFLPYVGFRDEIKI